ncbi:Hypp6977 [Branchiostoma lanceolatum]|uniref:Hypp6977 protein n=1 Tax=Branchiostoma lanceolatum TaxID=7740 RepID=A0A8J9YW45_BRALA|nr:Hypp6977 [Branchiostoma lanceolatum]
MASQKPVLPSTSAAGDQRDPRRQQAQPGQGGLPPAAQVRVEQLQPAADGQVQPPAPVEQEVPPDQPVQQIQQQDQVVVPNPVVVPNAQAVAQPRDEAQPGQGQPQAAGQAQPGVAALVQEMQELRRQVGALRQGRAADDMKEELVRYASRPQAAFDPHRALALVTQARKEGHDKAQEYAIVLNEISPLVMEDYFKRLIVNQFGSGILKQVARDISQFINSQGKRNRASSSARVSKVVAKPYNSGLKGKANGRRRVATPDTICYACNEKGHFARDCGAQRKTTV